MPVADAGGLAHLSREDRALAVVAVTLSGRDAPEILAALVPSRASLLVPVAQQLLEIPAAERLATLGGEAARLGRPPRIDPRALHPQRLGRLLASSPPSVRRVLGPLLGDATRAVSQAHPAATAVARSFLEKHLAAAPWPDELSASPVSVARLARATSERLAMVAEALGPARLAGVLAAAAPAVARWLQQRLPPEWDDDLTGVEPAEPHEALAALEKLTRTAGDRP